MSPRTPPCAPPVAPCIIGWIFAKLAEAQFRRALAISQGDPGVFVSHPISAALLLIAAIVFVAPFFYRWRLGKAGMDEPAL